MSDTHDLQVLILPINNCAFSAGYKNEAYFAQQTYQHYGVDLYSNVGIQTVYALGYGKVVACGWDGVTGNDKLGNVIAIQYDNVYIPNDIYNTVGTKILSKGDVINLVSRMFHFDQIYVKVGQEVTKDTVIGLYGNTGSTLVNGHKMGKHLHIELDTDTNFPTLAPGVKIGGAVFNTWSEYQRANNTIVDSTINPSLVWSLDYNQSIKGIYTGWYTDTDINLPKYSDLIAEINGNDFDAVATGIDVSYTQGSSIDFNIVKKSKDFVMIKLGNTNYEGGISIDSQFKNNIKKATESGIDIGVYIYAYDKSVEAAKKSAEETVEILKDYSINYPVAYDIEDTDVYPIENKSLNTDIVKSFLSTIESKRYYSTLYSYTSFANNNIDMSELTNYDVWISCTDPKNTLDKLWKYPYGIWQYKVGSCEGVQGKCDLDYAYKDYPTIIKNEGLNIPVNSDNREDLLNKIATLEEELKMCKEERSILMSENEKYLNELRSVSSQLKSICENIDNINI